MIEWFETFGAIEESRSLTKNPSVKTPKNGLWATFKEANDTKFGHANNPDTFFVKATIYSIKSENALYKSCPVDECRKKVIDQYNGVYRCEKCLRDYANFTYRLLANVSKFMP